MDIWCGSEPPKVCVRVEYVSLGLDKSQLPWCWQVRKALTLWQTSHIGAAQGGTPQIQSHELLNKEQLYAFWSVLLLLDSLGRLSGKQEEPWHSNGRNEGKKPLDDSKLNQLNYESGIYLTRNALMLHRYVFHTLLADVDVLATSMQNVLHDPLSQPVSWKTRKSQGGVCLVNRIWFLGRGIPLPYSQLDLPAGLLH